MLVHVVADYGHGDLAFAEVAQRLRLVLPDAEPLYTPVPAFARLPTGVYVIGVNAGYASSFVRDAAEELRWVSVPAGGSQFRSRDLFPEALADIVAGQPGTLAGEIPRSQIHDVPGSRVAYADGYLKTTVEDRMLGVPSGTAVRVRIGARELAAVVSDGSFEVEAAVLALAPGSSGWTRADGMETRWIELFLRGGSAWEAFDRPDIGARVEVYPGS